MYAFDENGNVLIDVSQSELINTATRNRTISRRAQAFSQNQFIPFQPVTSQTWDTFHRRLGAMFSDLFRLMKVPSRSTVATPRGGGDFRTLYFKALNDWASVDLQGFHGPIPAMEVSGLSDVTFFLPADGAVIRYLGRLLRKYPGFFQVSLGPGNSFTQRIATLDNSSAITGANHHGMCIRVRETLSGNVSGRIETNVGTLKAILRTMELGTILEGLNKILSTLSRKLKSLDGTWGEDPKFPIVNFLQKVPLQDWVDVSTYHQNFHGNNKDLYADRNVYGVIALGDKLPFVQSSGSSGEYKWTQPRS